jgi:hypothetical protein
LRITPRWCAIDDVLAIDEEEEKGIRHKSANKNKKERKRGAVRFLTPGAAVGAFSSDRPRLLGWWPRLTRAY